MERNWWMLIGRMSKIIIAIGIIIILFFLGLLFSNTFSDGYVPKGADYYPGKPHWIDDLYR